MTLPKPKDIDHIAQYWHLLDEHRIQCDLCPRACVIAKGKLGFCFVRQNKCDQLISITYGRSSGFAIDPIEKKPLNHFYPGSSILSFGTAGCNLGCQFCQNWSLSTCREFDRLNEKASPEMIAQSAQQRGCRSVAFTYNDPVIFIEYASDVADACCKIGVKTVAVTAGYICAEPRKKFFSKMDAANVDLKSFRNEFYERLCGGSLQPVLDTLVHIKKETKVWLEITTLLIPGENDSEEEIDEMTRWIVKELGPSVPLHFTAFHPAYKFRKHPSTPAKTLSVAREIARRNGLRYVYTGNVLDREGASTYCHICEKLLIEREGYLLGKYNLRDEGHCRHCGTILAGHFGKKRESS